MDMRVANAYNAYSVYNAKNTPGYKKTDGTGKAKDVKDTFSLSMQAEDYQAVRRALAGTPDVRSDRVSQLKARVDAGSYQVSADEIANKMLKGLDE